MFVKIILQWCLRISLKFPLNLLTSVRKIISFLDSLIPLPRDILHKRFAVNNFFIESIVTKNNPSKIIILYCHGGGFLVGLNVLYRYFSAKLATSLHAEVWLVDYPLLPDHAFPIAIECCIEAYFFLLQQPQCKIPIIIMGDSAGGNLAMASMIFLEKRGAPLPAAAVTISAWLDLSLSGESLKNKATRDPFLALDNLLYVRKFYSKYHKNLLDPLISPLFGDLKNLPPILMIVGENEILYDDTIRFANKAKKSNVQINLEIGQGMPHIYPLLFPKHPESVQAFNTISEFINKFMNHE